MKIKARKDELISELKTMVGEEGIEKIQNRYDPLYNNKDTEGYCIVLERLIGMLNFKATIVLNEKYRNDCNK